MRKIKTLFKQFIFCFISLSIFGINCSTEAEAQYPGINDSIAKYRKGELIIRAKKGDQVTVEQVRHEFWFGCAIPNNFAGGMPAEDLKMFKQKFLENFNSAVTENALKWVSMEPRKGQVNFRVVDSILNWTERNNIPLRGHNLFWGKTEYIQPWIMELSNSELLKTLQDRGESITSHYKGRFAEYDLNNEMLDENYYQERLGPDITRLMAQWALNGDKDAKLFLNEHDIFVPGYPDGNKLARCMDLIRNLLKQGTPIAGIGIQGHSHLQTFDRQALMQGLDSLATFKLPIRITEFNMPGRGYPDLATQEERRAILTPEQEESKATEITDFFKICFAHPSIEGIILWGFWEGANWIPSSSLYKRDWSPTPSALAYRNLVYKEWWTKESGIAGKKGLYSTRAFYGKYKITVNGISREVDLTRDAGKVEIDMRKL